MWYFTEVLYDNYSKEPIEIHQSLRTETEDFLSGNHSEVDGIPESCFKACIGRNCSHNDVVVGRFNVSDIYTRGCYPTLVHGFQHTNGIILGVFVGILVVHVLSIGSVVWVWIKIQKSYHYQLIVNEDDDVPE